MIKQQEPESLADIFKGKAATPHKKPPAYDWQEKALWVIKELSIPNHKRAAVFKVCRDLAPHIIERAVIDTKELVPSGEQWRYFFKIISQPNDQKNNYGKNFTRH